LVVVVDMRGVRNLDLGSIGRWIIYIKFCLLSRCSGESAEDRMGAEWDRMFVVYAGILGRLRRMGEDEGGAKMGG